MLTRRSAHGVGMLVATGLAGLGIVGASVGKPLSPDSVLDILVGVSFVSAGLVAWRRRPRNRVGLLMVAAGLTWLLRQCPLPLVPLPEPLTVVAGGLWPAVIAQLVVAFPTGRLGCLSSRLVVGGAYAESVLVGVVDPGRKRPVDLARTDSWLVGVVVETEIGVTVVLGLAVLALQVIGWRQSSVTRRRSLTLVLAAASVATVMFLVWMPVAHAGLRVPYLELAVQLALAAIPLAYLGSLLRRRFDRAGVADLVVRLNEATRPESLPAALATALHDPSLRIGYWLAEQDRYVNTEGQPVTVPPSDPGQVVTKVDRGGCPVAVLIHDPALLEEPELVDAACAAAALALENERLTAELRARLRQLATSRSRVLQATETERRRLERDLHDSIQQRLLSVAMTLGLAEAAGPSRGGSLVSEAKTAVLAALDDLRAVCHGIHPPVLTERGLPGAVQELTAVTPAPVKLVLDLCGPLPPEIETTAYYIVAESLANITKHASATSIQVAISDRWRRLVVEVDDNGCGGADPALGSGLRGLADRVEASGGELRVISPPSQGTQVRAVLPCG